MVRYVLHYNMPKNIDSLYQEMGRCSRDGERGECILFYSPQDVVIQKYMIENGNDTEDIPFEERRALDIYYVKNWSLMLDFSIFFRTIAVVIKGEGAK